MSSPRVDSMGAVLDYSTTRNLTTDPPAIRNEPGSKIQTALRCSPHERRQGEGGLRLRLQFKTGGFFDDGAGRTPPLISLVTVVYNGAAHMEKTVLSVLTQTYENVEYIVIDGGSTDGTLDILRHYDKAIDYWVSEPDAGISDAFNKGLSVSTGQFIGFINADDWYESNTAQLAIAAAMQHEADIVHGQLRYWSGSVAAELFSADHELLERDMTVNHPTVISRLAWYRRVGGFNGDFRYAMDYEWLRRSKFSGARFFYLAAPLANMRLGGISDVRWERAIREVARVKLIYSANKITPWISYGLQLIRGIARRVLEKMGLNWVVRFYHTRISLVSKSFK